MMPGIDPASLLEHVAETIRGVLATSAARGPCVTLAYAQSLDGSIASDVGTTTFIGGPQSRVLAHQLRALHDGVLVGVNTVLVDDPQLNVRHVKGADPRAIVVDSRLRTPLTARLLNGRSPCIVTTHGACTKKAAQLAAAGAEIVRVTADERNQVDLVELFKWMPAHGIRSLMVEGGAKVITRLLRQRLADQVVLTISPEWLGGLRAVEALDLPPTLRPRLENVEWCVLDEDMIVRGDVTNHVPDNVGASGRQHVQS